MKRSFVLALALTACSSTPMSTPVPSVSPPPVVTASRTPPASRTFSVANVMTDIDELATVIGPREATSPAFRRAIAYVRDRVRASGYNARVLAVPVPAGRVNKVAVGAGTTYDVIGEPPGYDPARPHIVVCGHVDTVPFAPGANDNASGVAVSLELARLARTAHLRIPVVFVAFGAEESRVQTPGVLPPKYGSRAYVRSLARPERAAIRGVIDLDMIGAGSMIHLGNSGAVLQTAFTQARRLHLPAALHVSTLSDHTSFEDAGIPVVWFWSGGHPSLHKPWDTIKVVQRAEIARMGALAWATMHALAM